MNEYAKPEGRSIGTVIGQVAAAAVLSLTLGLIGGFAANFLALSSPVSILLIGLMSTCGAIIGWCWWERILDVIFRFFVEAI